MGTDGRTDNMCEHNDPTRRDCGWPSGSIGIVLRVHLCLLRKNFEIPNPLSLGRMENFTPKQNICVSSSVSDGWICLIWQMRIRENNFTADFWSTRPTTVPAGSDNYFHADCPYVRTSFCPSVRPTQNFKIKQQSLPAGSVKLAEWIIDDSCLVFHSVWTN